MVRGRWGGCTTSAWGGCTTTAPHTPPALFGFFRPRPTDPNRASGEGKDGSDPPLFTAGAVRRWGGCPTRCPTGCTTTPPPSGGSLPSVCIPAGRLPRPARGPDDQPHRGARCVTDSSARFSSSAASAPRAPGRGRARSPRAIPWRSSSAFTRRPFTASSSRGTTSRPAWPASSPGNCSSVRHGLGSPGWASVCGAGPGPHVATFAHGRRAGQRDWRARFPVIRTADLAPDLGAGPRARRGDRRGARRREGVGLSTPVRAPLTAGWHASNPERRLATSRGLTVRSPQAGGGRHSRPWWRAQARRERGLAASRPRW